MIAMGKKATKSIVMQRTNEIYQALLSGWTRAEIIQYITNKQWNINDRQVDTYIQKANKIITQKGKEVQDNAFVWHIQNRLQLYRQAGDDKRLKLDIVKDLAHIQGLYDDNRGKNSDNPFVIKIITEGVADDTKSK